MDLLFKKPEIFVQFQAIYVFCLVIKIEHFLDVTINYFKTLWHFKRWFFRNEQFSFKSEVEFRFALAQSLSSCIYLNDLPHPRRGGQRSVIACLHPFTFEILAKIKSYGIVSDTFYDNWKRKSGSGLRCKKKVVQSMAVCGRARN